MSTLPPAPPPPSHLPWAIAMTVTSILVFCILGTISGIVAIVYGAQVTRRFDAGDEAGADEASRSARVWCWITTILIILGLSVVALFFYSGGWAKYQQMMEELGRIQLHG